RTGEPCATVALPCGRCATRCCETATNCAPNSRSPVGSRGANSPRRRIAPDEARHLQWLWLSAAPGGATAWAISRLGQDRPATSASRSDEALTSLLYGPRLR